MRETSDSDAIAGNVDHDFPSLHRFFGGYFHEDWQQDYSSTTAAVAAYLHEAPLSSATSTAAELDRLLVLQVDDAALGRLLRDGFDCNYVPQADELSTRAWLERVRDELRRAKPV